MSTNDDSASRRGRRADQVDHRGPVRQDRDDRWDQSSSRERIPSDPYQDPRARDAQQQRPGYSGFSRHAYSNSPEPALPQPQQPQGYYQDPSQRIDPARYVDPSASAYTPPPPPYEPEPSHPGFHDSGRDDLFGRDSAASAYGQNAYGSQGAGFQNDLYDTRSHQPPSPPNARRDDPSYLQREAAPLPADDYERNFQARSAQDASQAARFFLPEEEQQKPRAAQPERAYTPAPPPPQQFAASNYPPQDHFDNHFEDNWTDEHALPEDAGGDGHHDLIAQGHDLDDDFFADEDELESDPIPAPKRSRKKLMLIALAGALVTGGGGAYFYKSLKSGGEESATPFIRADNRPLKEPPGNPGGKQFPNGEKTIYDRLTPDGQQIQTAAYAPPAPVAPPASAQPAPANSLEERIDEALRKAQQTNDAPPPAPMQTGRAPDQPTVVHSESYRPDGTRVDAGRPMVTPSIADANGGLPPPFGNAAQLPAAPAPAPTATPFRTVPVPSTPQLAAASPAPRTAAPTARSASITPAEPSAAPSGGFWVSLKSAPDEKAIQKDLTILTDKYKSVLGDVPVTSKIADLGSRGVTYRAVAGPLGSRQEAMELCQKIKGVGGDKACFVTN